MVISLLHNFHRLWVCISFPEIIKLHEMEELLMKLLLTS